MGYRRIQRPRISTSTLCHEVYFQGMTLELTTGCHSGFVGKCIWHGRLNNDASTDRIGLVSLSNGEKIFVNVSEATPHHPSDAVEIRKQSTVKELLDALEECKNNGDVEGMLRINDELNNL